MANKSNQSKGSAQPSTKMMARPDAGYNGSKFQAAQKPAASVQSKGGSSVIYKSPTPHVQLIKGGATVFQKNIPPSGMQPYYNLRNAVGAPPKIAETRMSPGEQYKVGSIAFNSTGKPQKAFQTRLGDDMADSIEQRAQARVAERKPLHGVSVQGRNPLVSPMAGQGAPYPGPNSPVAGKPSFPAYQNNLNNMMLSNYQRDRAPTDIVEAAGGQNYAGSGYKDQSYPRKMSPIAEGVVRGGMGLFGGLAGGAGGALAAGGSDVVPNFLNRMMNRPYDGSGMPNTQQLSGGGHDSNGTSGFVWPPKPAANPLQNPMQNPMQMAQANAPAGLQRPSYMYPEYSQQAWANLPRGIYGR